MDFSDQIELGARLAGEQPDVGALERARFKVVLLDEYQDTSVAQATDAVPALRAAGHAVTAVGDPNQAIYGWRGASVSNILSFADTFPAADRATVPTYPLTVNRRSDRRILEVANRLAAAALRRRTPARCGRSAAKPDAGRGERRGRGSSRPTPTSSAWLADAVDAAHDARRPGGPTSACSPATTPTPPTSSTR